MLLKGKIKSSIKKVIEVDKFLIEFTKEELELISATLAYVVDSDDMEIFANEYLDQLDNDDKLDVLSYAVRELAEAVGDALAN